MVYLVFRERTWYFISRLIATGWLRWFRRLLIAEPSYGLDGIIHGRVEGFHDKKCAVAGIFPGITSLGIRPFGDDVDIYHKRRRIRKYAKQPLSCGFGQPFVLNNLNIFFAALLKGREGALDTLRNTP